MLTPYVLTAWLHIALTTAQFALAPNFNSNDKTFDSQLSKYAQEWTAYPVDFHGYATEVRCQKEGKGGNGIGPTCDSRAGSLPAMHAADELCSFIEGEFVPGAWTKVANVPNRGWWHRTSNSQTIAQVVRLRKPMSKQMCMDAVDMIVKTCIAPIETPDPDDNPRNMAGVLFVPREIAGWRPNKDTTEINVSTEKCMGLERKPSICWRKDWDKKPLCKRYFDQDP
ncbi:MAG: hypothetical protein M1833_004485 [Piccolia ochrophora]|nr:MAG: hypothetical protein M1833_004485 [Piccolia ochrophora]